MSAKENTVWIRTPDPDYFQNLTGISLSKDASVVRVSSKSDHSLGRYKPNCGENALSRNVEEFLDPDPEADDFENLTSSSLCTDTSVVKIYRRSV